MLETMGGRNAAHRRTRRFPLRLGVCLLALAGAVLFAQAGASEAPAEGAQPAGGATASTVYAWGEDGLGSVTSLDETPVTVPAAAGATAIAAGDPASFAVLPDGHVISWQTGSKPRPVAGLRDVTTISAGFDHILALLSNGTVAAWGENYSGQLGDGTTTASTTPVAVTGLSDVKALANGYGFSLALRADGTVMGWGDDGIGQLALGRSPSLSSCSGIPCATTPVAIPGLSHVTAIAAGSSDGYALTASGTVMAWGDNVEGELGLGTDSGPDHCSPGSSAGSCAWSPVVVPGLHDAVAVTGGFDNALAVLAGGTVEGWGGNSTGELGLGTATGPNTCDSNGACSLSPVAVKGIGDAVQVASGGYGIANGGSTGSVCWSMALLRNGTVMAWGAGGDLGDGSRAFSPTPVAVRSLSGITSIAAGTVWGIALRAAPAASRTATTAPTTVPATTVPPATTAASAATSTVAAARHVATSTVAAAHHVATRRLPASGAGARSGIPAWVWVIVALVAVALLVLILIWRRRRQDEDGPAASR